MPQPERRALKKGTVNMLAEIKAIMDNPAFILSPDSIDIIRLTVKVSCRSLQLTCIILGSFGVKRLRPRYRVMKS